MVLGIETMVVSCNTLVFSSRDYCTRLNLLVCRGRAGVDRITDSPVPHVDRLLSRIDTSRQDKDSQSRPWRQQVIGQ